MNCALLSYDLAQRNRGFRDGEGIVKENVEETISSIGRLASKGMRQADNEILNIMIGK